MKLLYLAITLFIFSNSLKAEEVGYEVEVIIFEDSTGTYANSEIWQDEANNISASDSVEIINGNRSTYNTNQQSSMNIKKDKEKFTFISKDKLRLKNQANKLSTHAEYKVLYHRAWIQPGLDKDQAFPVHIDSRTPLSTESILANSPNSNGDYIDGSITLIMSRYLHINTELVYHKQIPQENLSSNENSTSSPNANLYKDFVVKFERRMRSREVHYIDHPMVGIIVLATPYKILEPTTPNSPNTQYKSL